jgi:hypothetical protein
MDRIPPQQIYSGLIAKATYLVRHGGLRFRLLQDTSGSAFFPRRRVGFADKSRVLTLVQY